MNLLLDAVTTVILPIAILLLALIVAIYLYKALRKRFNKPLDTKIKANSKAQVSLKSNYCSEDEMRFLEALHQALPRECISFPRVGVSKLIDPKGSMNDYKSVLDQYVDVVVFQRKDILCIKRRLSWQKLQESFYFYCSFFYWYRAILPLMQQNRP